ncbi:uncharacterized protein LOC129905616 [Episyrphus balteatus]|uniref:uncharacterized protein LOC129905616 n=1 Tax=Episyrphus balteatus TaxID=286459 RepID=UPI0024858D4F|nr:uncharacterized protein LOC129905616 [Episyrphus balteatus]
MEEASLLFIEILSKCKAAKIDPLQLKSSKVLITRQKCHLTKKEIYVLITIILASIVWLLCPFYPNNSQCSIGFPDNIRKAFRPPVKCDFCQGVSNIQKVKRISSEDFEQKFAYSGVPVVVTDATVNWTSLSTFDFWYFKDTYSLAKHKNKILNCQFFPYKSGFRNLFEALENPPEHFHSNEKAWYFGWSNCNPETAEQLRQHYGRPYFLPETSENNAVDWIFMGTSGLGAHMHVDNVRLPSWQAQLAGSKKWILMPPPECYFWCNRVEIVMDEGDIIIIDTNKWYHQTIVLPGKISITIGAEYD